MDIKQSLLVLCSSDGVSGNETAAVNVAAEILRDFCNPEDITVDILGNLIATIVPAKPGQEHILLDAHIDGIGMIVTGIDDQGFLKVAPCGGMDRRILSASEVIVHGKEDIFGVIASTPPHLQSGKQKNPSFDDLVIDIGFNKEQAEQLVSLGDRVTLKAYPQELLNGCLANRFFDDRSGCVAVLYAAEQIRNANPNCGVTVTLSTREEVGGEGAKTSSFAIDPTQAIEIDVTYAYMPTEDPNQCGKLGKGPMIGFAPALDMELSRTLVNLAKEKEIPYQLEVMNARTYTNADEISSNRGGVKTGMISVPLKYMHTAIEVLNPADVKATGDLIAAYVLQLDN